MTNKLLFEVLNGLEKYENELSTNQSPTLKNFSLWLSGSELETEAHSTQAAINTEIDSELGRLVVILGRYAKSYSKIALKNEVNLATYDDFVYLLLLYFRPNFTKTQLIHQSLHEKTTGTEIIKRLIVNKLVVQNPHPQDKRTKLLAITEQGKTVIDANFSAMHNVANLVTGNLTAPEKQTLLVLLEKLNHFHQNIDMNTIEKNIFLM